MAIIIGILFKNIQVLEWIVLLYKCIHLAMYKQVFIKKNYKTIFLFYLIYYIINLYIKIARTTKMPKSW